MRAALSRREAQVLRLPVVPIKEPPIHPSLKLTCAKPPRRRFSKFRELRSAVSVERVWKDVFSFPRSVGAWRLAAREEARQGRIPNCAVVAEDESA